MDLLSELSESSLFWLALSSAEVILGVLASEHKLSLWWLGAFTVLFLFAAIVHVLRKVRGTTNFSIEPDWRWSQQSVRRTGSEFGRELYTLQAFLTARFLNGDNRPHIIKSASAVLFRKSHWWWPLKLIATSHDVLFYPKTDAHRSHGLRLDGSGNGLSNGLKCEPHTLGQYYCLHFYIPLPNGVIELDECVAIVRFDLLDGAAIVLDMAVSCPRPNESYHYDSDGLPQADGTSIQPVLDADYLPTDPADDELLKNGPMVTIDYEVKDAKHNREERHAPLTLRNHSDSVALNVMIMAVKSDHLIARFDPVPQLISDLLRRARPEI